MPSKLANEVIDTDYTKIVPWWGYPKFEDPTSKKAPWYQKFFGAFWWKVQTTGGKAKSKVQKIRDKKDKEKLKQKTKELIEMPDEKYSHKLLDQQVKKYLLETEKEYKEAIATYKTYIAPSYREFTPTYFNISGLYGKTYYANRYPSYLDMLWTRDLLSLHGKRDASWFVYPSESDKIAKMLRDRATQLRQEINEALRKWITVNTELEVQYRDIEQIREKLATREEKYFQASFYFTVYHEDKQKLREEGRKFEQKMWGFSINVKPAIHRMDEGFISTWPFGLDQLGIYRSMVTTSLGGSFPFISADIIEDSGIMYGINLHTWTLVIFDRFSRKLPNYNSVVLATSGAGKSFAVKLEILRYLMLWIDSIIIDPENEYKALVDKVWGVYINISANSHQHINPFDLPPKIEDVDYKPWDLLRSKILDLIGLIDVLLWGLSPKEEAIIDKALQETYRLKGITFEDENPEGKEPPLMQDLYYVLESMEWGENLAIRLSKYVTWTFANLFNNPTNVNLQSGLTVFSIRDIEESLKTPAMYNILNFIWTAIRAKKKKRLLAIDEAWIMMQHDLSANFLFGLIKRARKYWLGVTTITQDIEDFVKSPWWKPIVSNSAMQLLLKQSTVSIKALAEIFSLSEAEKQKLVASDVGEGLFFAGNQHIAIKILASPYEKDFITTDVK